MLKCICIYNVIYTCYEYNNLKMIDRFEIGFVLYNYFY